MRPAAKREKYSLRRAWAATLRPTGPRQRGSLTFAAVAECFLQDQAGRLKARTLVNYELYFRLHAVPFLGNVKIDAVTRADVSRLHRNGGRAKPITANICHRGQ